MLSDVASENIEIQAFDSGADDFIRKPLFPEAFIRRIMNRIHAKEQNSIQLESTHTGQSKLYIDRESFTVFLNQQPISISKKEFELLHLMASSPGKIFTRDEIFEKIWKRKSGLNDRTIDVHILRLRKKLGEEFISTQKGVGYRFELRSIH